MEEIQQAQFTVCDPADANAAIATDANAAAPVGCAASSTTEKRGPEAGNTRPYDNVNDYVPVGYTLGTPCAPLLWLTPAASWWTGMSRRRAGLSNAVGSTLGKVSMDGITTTLTLNLVNGLGGTITSTAQNMIALQITITVNYGPGESSRWISHPLPARRAMSLPSAARQHGFTLIETIVVMMITAILAGIMVLFIRRPVQNYVDNAARADMADVAEIALRRMTRELRGALPNSVRWAVIGNTSYIEFIPTKSGARYLASDDGADPSLYHALDFSGHGAYQLRCRWPCRPRLTRSRLATRS
jgi:prepilin-type N-terminal cleavage/methylation domain-containing protein